MAYKVIARLDDGSEASWKVSWNIDGPKSASKKQPFQSSNVVFEQSSVPVGFALRGDGLRIFLQLAEGSQNELQPADLGHPNAFKFLLETLEATILTGQARPRAVKLVAPCSQGNIIRADLLPQRMQDLEYIEKTTALARPLQSFTGQEWTVATDLTALFRTSIGAIRLRETPATQTTDAALNVLKDELCNRLPDAMVLAGLTRRTIVFIDGSGVRPNRGGYAAQFYGAAEALGVDVVVLAAEGHWIQGPEYSYWRKAFIPTSLDEDDDFSSRIVASVKKYGGEVHGMMTYFDSFQIAVSKAAHELGIPAEPTAAYEVIGNKHSTSVFEGRKSFKVASHDEAMNIARTEAISWPIIVKPCLGWASELVFKIDNIGQLAACESIKASAKHGNDFVMEPYCDGPEVDINFVMYDGEVLFWEIGDEDPKTADNGADSFHECDCCSPSELPKAEQNLLRDSIVESLLKLGFRNGLYHCEARVGDSAMEWRVTESGASELAPRQVPRARSPSSFLIEVNPRPPGINSSDIIETTWGVDYFAVLIAIRVRDSERVRALAQPFRQGPAYFGDMIFLSAAFDSSKKGVWESGLVTEELCQQRPDLARHVSKHLTYKRKGDLVPHRSTGINTFVGYINVFSHTSRAHVMEIAAEVRREVFKLIEWS